MQVKYKLQAVVNNCDIIRTLNFSVFYYYYYFIFFFFGQLSLICCSGSRHRNSQQYDGYVLFLLLLSVWTGNRSGTVCFNHGCDL